MYTLLMVPVIYGAAKLVANTDSNSGETGAGIACIVLLPLPVLAYWAHVLWYWYTDPTEALVKRSRSSILRAYQRPAGAASMAGAAHAAQQEVVTSQQQQQQQQRAKATLALLGDLDDNPTLIIRDRRSGEDEADEAFARGTRSSSDDGEEQRSSIPANRPTASTAGGTASADGTPRVRSQREGKAQMSGSRWRSLVSEQGGSAGSADGAGCSSRSSRSMEGSTGGVLGSKSKDLRAGSPAPPAGEELAPQGRRCAGPSVSATRCSAHCNMMFASKRVVGSGAHDGFACSAVPATNVKWSKVLRAITAITVAVQSMAKRGQYNSARCTVLFD
jgi:hypothetical protein